MNIDGILIMNSETGLPLFSKLNNIDETLFSGLVTAIRSFIRELSLGGLSSFSTDKKHIFLTGRDKITTCIISDKNIDFKIVYSLSLVISKEFEKNFKVENLNKLDISSYNQFNDRLQIILSKNDTPIPYALNIAEFVKKEFGGNISYNPKLKDKNGKIVTFDLVLDKGKKDSGLKSKFISKVHKSFSRNTVFIKIFEELAGKAEVEEFFETIKSFDSKNTNTNESNVFEYFPRKLAIFAPDYSPTVLDEVKKLKRIKRKAYIAPQHILHVSNMHARKNNAICFVELWQVEDDCYPKRIFS